METIKMKNKNKTKKKGYLKNPLNEDRFIKQKKPLPFVYSEELLSNIKNSDWTFEDKLTGEEKKTISNELDELLNNPNVSISSNTRDVIKNSFVSAKSLYISENIELKWYKTAQNYIRIL